MIVCPNRERKERLMRVIFKICILPVILILSMMKLLLDVAERVYCLVAGVAINALIVCVVLALITGQWLALGVFGAWFIVLMAKHIFIKINDDVRIPYSYSIITSYVFNMIFHIT